MTKIGAPNLSAVAEQSSWVDSLPIEYENIVKAYSKSQKPVEVDFRKLVPFRSGVDRATHLFHSYPAKLLPNIPIFFLNCGLLTDRRSVVYDPFCGTGTVLVEALLAGHIATGADANPLARKITHAKTTRLPLNVLLSAIEDVSVATAKTKPAAFTPVVNVDKWFSDDAQVSLGKLRAAIHHVESDEVREFLEVSFSQCVRKASLADPRMTVPVRRKDGSKGEGDVVQLFIDVAQSNAERLQKLPVDSPMVWVGNDARKTLCNETENELQADIIITSPPYAGAQKYIRASSLSLGWLGLVPDDKLRNLERQNIGREHLTEDERCLDWSTFPDELRSLLDQLSAKNKLRASIFALYLQEMQVAMSASVASLKASGVFVLVIGDNQVCGLPVKTSTHIKAILENEGLEVQVEMVDAISSRGLMTKRNKTAGIISHEHVIVFKKSNGKAGRN